ncbi:hypothetical protein BKI52_14035 [marine bacterium AO1-C]|nr:hypothetical protein BKI52_14035 [marine bacterium AO1-C]
MKILLVDDHKIVRQILKEFLVEKLQGIEVDEANNGVEGFNKVKQSYYDLIIADINMPQKDGIQMMRDIHAYDPNLKVVALSMMDDQVSIKKMLQAGAVGYVLKEGNTQELLNAIQIIVNGNKYFSPNVAEVIMSSLTKNKTRSSGVKLTKREKEVLQAIFEEKSNQQIADELFISPRTVETHKYNIMEKTGARNLAGLVKYAIREKLFDDLFY